LYPGSRAIGPLLLDDAQIADLLGVDNPFVHMELVDLVAPPQEPAPLDGSLVEGIQLTCMGVGDVTVVLLNGEGVPLDSLVIHQGARAVLQTAPVAHWKLDELEGPVAFDSVGRNDGVVYGSPVWLPDGGVIDGALQFDGIDDYVSCGTFNPSEATGQLTVCLWANWSGPNGQYQGLIGKRDSFGAQQMMWQTEASVQTADLSFSRAGDAGVAGAALPIGEWAHVAVTFDGSVATFYRDGEETGSGPFSFGSHTTASLVFGACERNGGNPFNGALDDVRLYDQALSHPQIQAVMTGVDATGAGPEDVVVDDFEGYTDALVARIFQTWIDGWGYSEPTPGKPGNGTGATVGHQNPPHAETQIVHTGLQSMPLEYNNGVQPYYSETEREFAPPQNWVASGADMLVLYVRGEATNDPTPLYVAVEDASDRVGVCAYPDPAAARSTSWIKCEFPLSVFVNDGVDLTTVRMMYIGVGDRDNPQPGGAGTFYIDDIYLDVPASPPHPLGR
jgi:hypothetical protein